MCAGACVCACTERWISKVLLEIINIFLIFSDKITKKELSKTISLNEKKVVQKSDNQ